MVTARCLWFVAPRRVEIRDEPLPPLADGEVLVHTAFSGISAGTELLAYRSELDPDLAIDDTIGALDGTFQYPYRYGYSCVGPVVETRSEQFPRGTTVFAFQPHQDLFVAAANDVVAVACSARQATLFPLVETALQITLDAGPVLGDTVCVFGLGAVGTLTALMLRHAGARVVGVEPRPWRRQIVAGLGVETVAPQDVRAQLTTDGRLVAVPLIVDASGHPEALRSALGLLAHEGTVLVASWYGTKEVPLPLGREFHRRRLTIRSTQVSTIPAWQSDRWDADRRRHAVVDLLDELALDRLATHTVPFAAAADAYAALDAGDEGVMHIALGYT